MQRHSANYTDAFIEAAEDCPAVTGTVPPGAKARAEYDMLYGNPYLHTCDDVIYAVYGKPKGISRDEFFSKGQPCLRASPLTKRYGWGIHCDGGGRIAVYAVDSPEYRSFAADRNLRHLRAMRNGKSGPR